MSRAELRALDLFSMYMQVTGVPTLEPEPGDDPLLCGKKLGIVNGASWIALWTNYFGRQALPGVKLINVGNEAIQLSFMQAHAAGRPCPPKENIETFARYARELVDLYGVDAILVSCSTMNRATGAVRAAVAEDGVPVVQIDEPMMEEAVSRGGPVLVVATHGPTVCSTQALLQETAERLGRQVSLCGATVERAFEQLGGGDIVGHNETIAGAIRRACTEQEVDVVVLAQLSMTVFKLSYPDCRGEFGVDVLTSGELGFRRVRRILRGEQAA